MMISKRTCKVLGPEADNFYEFNVNVNVNVMFVIDKSHVQGETVSHFKLHLHPGYQKSFPFFLKSPPCDSFLLFLEICFAVPFQSVLP